MKKAIERRLAVAERRTMPVSTDLHVIIVEGGLHSGDPIFAQAGTLRWFRAPTESFSEFRAKVLSEAISAGEMLVVFGGLPGPEFIASDFEIVGRDGRSM
jgi:hypothetical protein